MGSAGELPLATRVPVLPGDRKNEADESSELEAVIVAVLDDVPKGDAKVAEAATEGDACKVGDAVIQALQLALYIVV